MVIIVEKRPPSHACPSQREGVLTGEQRGCEDLVKNVDNPKTLCSNCPGWQPGVDPVKHDDIIGHLKVLMRVHISLFFPLLAQVLKL